MERLTFEGNFCEIAKCEGEYRMTSECADGACSQRKVWERLKAYEDTGLEPEDILVVFNEAACTKLAEQLLGTTPERLAELVKADKAGLLVIIPEPSDGLEHDLLEPMKIGYALKSEIMKLNMRLARDPKSVCHLDYTIIAALQAVLEGGGSDA